MRLIDADALLKKTKLDNLYGVLWEIYHAPTIDAVPVVHGEWIKRREFVEDMQFDGFRCSACNWWKGDFETYNYCPNCGAKMEVQAIKSVTMREGDTDTDGFMRKAVEAVMEVQE